MSASQNSAVPLTPEDLVYGLRIPGEAVVSPDGSRVAYTLRGADGDTHRTTSEVWVCGIDGSASRCIASDAYGARWSPDGRRLALVARTAAGTALRLLDPDGGAHEELTFHRSDMLDLAWSPDGARIAYVAEFDPEDPEEQGWSGVAPKVLVARRLDYKQDGRGFRGDSRDHLFVIGTSDGERRRLSRAVADHSGPAWSPDGSSIASGPVIIDAVSGDVTRAFPGEGNISHWSWSPGGERILYVADLEHAQQPDLYLYSVSRKRLERLTTDLETLPAGAVPGLAARSDPVWLDDRIALLHTMHRAKSGLELVDTTTGARELVVRWETRHGGMSADRERRVVVQTQQSASEPGEVSVYERASGALGLITRHNAWFSEHAAPVEQFTVQRPEFEIDVWLQKPRQMTDGERYPVVLDVHGGPLAADGTLFSHLRQLLASRGFLVAMSNPRGSSTYGRRFAQAVVRDWGGGDYGDVMAALEAVASRPCADPERAGVYGYSYGGFMCSWIIGQTERFKAAVCGSPMFDLVSSWGTSDVHYRGLEIHGGGPPHVEREWFAVHSPHTWAHRAKTPTLVIHGEEDLRIAIGQSEELFVALKKAGVPTELVRYPKASHMFFVLGEPEHRVDWLTRTVEWFERYLKPVAAAS